MEIDFSRLFYDLQKEIVLDDHRFKVVSCGRRWGKTFMAMGAMLYMLMDGWNKTGRKQRGWVVAPTFPLVKEDWLMTELLLKDVITSKHQTEMKMTLGERAFIEFKSAEREDEGLRGAGLDVAVIDEASRVSRKSWEQGLRPALADKQGRAIFISTPKGRNWFYDLFIQGKNGSKEVRSWQHPTYSNPFFPKSEWEVIKVTTPEMILRQEYEADFLEDEATVFKNLSRCLRGSFEPAQAKEFYTIGIDLGKNVDFTVISVFKNSTKQLVDLYRENRLDWTVQKDLIKGVCSRYKNHLAIIDSTGLGDPIADDLRKSGVNIKDYKFSNTSKEALVEQLVIAIEQGLIGIPELPQTQFLIDEIKAFNYEILPSGKVRYEAPSGLHDDGVISIALAIMGLAPVLYEKPKVLEGEKKWGTADDWEAYYKMLDYEQKKNPFMTREEAVNRIKARRWKRLVRV